MTAVLRDTPIRDFPRPDGLEHVEVCADSGLLPLPANSKWLMADGDGQNNPMRSAISHQLIIVPCPHRRFEWFIVGTEPTEVDRSHVQVTDPTTGHTETIWMMPPEYAAWARENKIAQPDEGRIQDEGRMTNDEEAQNTRPLSRVLRLASPDPNRSYVLDPGLPASTQQTPVTAQPGLELADVDRITLLVDGTAFAEVRGPDFTAWWPLTKGRHIFTAIATRSDGLSVASEPIAINVE